MPEENTPASEEPQEQFRRLTGEVDGGEGQSESTPVSQPVESELPDAGDIEQLAAEETTSPPPAEGESETPFFDELAVEPGSEPWLAQTRASSAVPNDGQASRQDADQLAQTRASRIEPGEKTPPIDPAGQTRASASRQPTNQNLHRSKTPPHGMPRYRQVEQQDSGATRVTPRAYRSTSAPGSPVSGQGAVRRQGTAGGAGQVRRPPRGVTPPPTAPRAARRVVRPAPRVSSFRQGLGCLLRASLLGAFVAILVALCGVSFLLYQYYAIARTLPDIRDLRTRASQFETTRILDRNGNTLYEILDPHAGRRTYVPLSKISPYLVATTVATEDKGFYTHPGVDLLAILRAVWQNYQSGETVSGASTITQQLARTLLLSPEERVQQTYERKVREAILATEITRRYSKDDILELYLNENYYGNLAYGVEAAAETYFGTTSDKLTLGQASFLAGLPQAPSIYDVYTNREATLNRQKDVLVLTYQASQEENCIYVSNSPERVCIDPVAVTKAVNEIKDYQFKSADVQMRYPHWVNYVRSLLESQFDAQQIYRSGFTVYTTLEPNLQDMAQKMVAEQVGSLAEQHVTDGALVAIQPGTGQILAMVGSADFYNEAISGQVNMAVSPRQPGSSIKPLTYVAAFEKGWTPGTLIWDVPSEFPPSGRPDDTREPYRPVNYDGRFHGPVTVRTALANSYNIPAVKTLNFIGIYDDPATPTEDGFLAFARRMGITTLTRPDYGLSLTLGGGDVSLLEMTSAFGTFANLGRRIPPVAITRIVDHTGKVVYDYQQPAGDQVVRAEHAYLITSILSDNQARTPAFGANSVLKLPFPAAAKTGTTNDFRDNWTLGYTPDLAVGVWVGNADYTAMQNTTGLTGAAPIWSQFMQAAEQQLTGGNPTPFSRPAGVVEYVICAASGTEPSQWCPEQRNEIFAADQPPLPKEQDLWQELTLDTWTELRASAACPDFTEKVFVLNVTDSAAKRWLNQDASGRQWAADHGFRDQVEFPPSRECKSTDPRPQASFASPGQGSTMTVNPIDLYGVASATGWFRSWRLDYGIGDNPVEWRPLIESQGAVGQPNLLMQWDVQGMVNSGEVNGPVTVRLRVQSDRDTFAETFLHLNIDVPAPTATPEPTATETPVPTITPPAPATQTPGPGPTLPPASTDEAGSP